jgi:hypothetical protein
MELHATMQVEVEVDQVDLEHHASFWRSRWFRRTINSWITGSSGYMMQLVEQDGRCLQQERCQWTGNGWRWR